MRRWAVGIFVAVWVSTAAAQEKPSTAISAEIHRDLLYRDSDDATETMRERCRLDMYVPPSSSNFPTVIWFHGGGLKQGNKSIPKALLGQGIAVVAPNYRLHPDVQSPAYLEDAAAAVAWTMENMETYGGSRDRIFVAGHSAGGYLAMMIGLDPRWLRAHGHDPNGLAGMIPLSGQCITHFTIRAERGIAETQPVVDEMAPLFHVRKDAPPILLVTGDRERELLGRYEENAYLWRMLRIIGHPDVELNELQGYDHGGMAEPAFPLLVRFVQQHAKQGKDAVPTGP